MGTHVGVRPTPTIARVGHVSRAVLGVVSLATMLALFVANLSLARYVDEADNLLGGRLLAEGDRLYGDFFSHHMPVPYLVTATAHLLGANSLETYRLSFALALTLVLASAFVLLKECVSPVVLATTIVTIGLVHPIYLGYMVLADHLFAYALLILVLLALARGAHLGLGAQAVVAAAIFVAVGSTLISVYPLAALAVAYGVARWRARASRPIRLHQEAVFVGLIAAPWLVLLGTFAVQGTLGTFLSDAIVFNQRYYARYDIGADPATMLENGLSEFSGLVVTYLRPNRWNEVETVLLAFNLGAVLVVARRRGLGMGVLYAALVFLSRMRGPGYHGAPYFVLSFASLGLVVDWSLAALRPVLVLPFRARPALSSALSPEVSPTHAPRSAFLMAAATAVVGVLALAYVAWFYRDIGGFVLRLPRGQGVHSPYSAPVSALTSAGDQIWVAPLDPTVYLDTDRRPASVFTYYHPWLADSPEITEGVLRDLQAHRPPVIVFEADKHIDWLFPLPTPAEYAARVYAFITAAYEQDDPNDSVLRNVYLRRDIASSLRTRQS